MISVIRYNMNFIAVDIAKGETQKLHVLPTPVVMLTGCRGIIIIIYITVLTTKVAISSAGDNNVVYIVKGKTQTFTCTTDSSRHAAWIQWYIDEQNVTNQATPQPPQQDRDKFISYSRLVHTGRDVDHNKTIFCEAVNIEGRLKVKSTEKSLYIQCKLYCLLI